MAVTEARWKLLLVLGVVLACSLQVRFLNGSRVAEQPGAEAGSWFSYDPDSLYHMRRVERALESGGHVAVRDPLLAYPEHRLGGGAPVPWPGFYSQFLVALSTPFAPDLESERKVFVEQLVASVPMALGALTSLLVAWAVARWGGWAPGLFAGLYHGLTFASMRYSRLGEGDHHAWVSLLGLALLLSACRGLDSTRTRNWTSAALHGLLAGLFAGLGLGSWVAFVIHIGFIQLSLLWLLWNSRSTASGRSELGGPAAFGCAFHAAALLVVLPECLVSPWPATELVNLSLLHLAYLATGALASLLVWRWKGGLQAGGRVVDVGAGILLLVGLGWLAVPLAHGLAEGLQWAIADNSFMGAIQESQPLVGGALGGLGPITKWLGFGALALPLAWWFCWRRCRDQALPLLLSLPLLVVMALLQRRFAEGVAAPAAVCMGLALALVLHRGTSPKKLLPAKALVVLLAFAAHPTTVRLTFERLDQPSMIWETATTRQERGLRQLLQRLPEPAQATGAVLAQWDQGHLIEWVARRPTIATNFGLYLGLENYLAPWRFMLAPSDAEAEALMERFQARHVLLGSDWYRNRESMLAALPGTTLDGSLVERLLTTGASSLAGETTDVPFLRLLAVGPRAEDGRPAGWLWERVRGARLRIAGPPGEQVSLRVRRRFAPANVVCSWSTEALAGEDGVCEVRVPWCSTQEGPGDALGPLELFVRGRMVQVAVPEEAVLYGDTLEVRLTE